MWWFLPSLSMLMGASSMPRNSPSSGPNAAGGPPSSPDSTWPNLATWSSFAPSSTMTPTRQLPSAMLGGVSATITNDLPDTSTPSMSPLSTSNANANRQ